MEDTGLWVAYAKIRWKKNHRGFELSVSKIIVCIALYCFGQSLMGTLLSQAEFYAVEFQAEIEHTSESRSKSNLISSLAENVGCVGFLPPPPSQQFLSCQVRATFPYEKFQASGFPEPYSKTHQS